MFSLSKRYSDKTKAVSVFPTPVGPKNKKEPRGREGFCIPVLARNMVSVIAFRACDCPLIF